MRWYPNLLKKAYLAVAPIWIAKYPPAELKRLAFGMPAEARRRLTDVTGWRDERDLLELYHRCLVLHNTLLCLRDDTLLPSVAPGSLPDEVFDVASGMDMPKIGGTGAPIFVGFAYALNWLFTNPKMLLYRDRITCFVDVLGFSADIRSVQSDDDGNEILSMLKNLQEIRDENARDRKLALVQHGHLMTSFSDCILMSYDYDPADAMAPLLQALRDVARLCRAILAAGYLPRGGIALGWLHHDEQYAFGAGLIDAYALESTCAVMPRVILSSDLCKLAYQALDRYGLRASAYLRDGADYNFVHILGEEWAGLEKSIGARRILDHDWWARDLRDVLEGMLERRRVRAKDQRALEKIEWFRNYARQSGTEQRRI
jgi:hypothetical protein